MTAVKGGSDGDACLAWMQQLKPEVNIYPLTPRIMKILFSAKGRDWDSELDPRFGRAQGFLLYDDQQDQLQWYANEENKNAAHGAGIQAAQRAAGLGANFLITGHVGPKADATLKSSAIQVFPVEENCTIREAYNNFLADKKK